MNNISEIATKIREVVGMTTQEFGIKKMQKALDWVLRWGWSTPGLVDALGGTSRGHCANLVAKKMLIATPTASGAIAGFPAKTVTVTKLGMTMIGDVEIVESLKSKKPRIVPQNLRHDVLVQKIVLCAYFGERDRSFRLNVTGAHREMLRG